VKLVLALDELRKARRFVEDGEKYVLKQRATIARLERQGDDALEDILFLECLEEMQERYEAHRDRLERQVLALVKPEGD
jgi:hypothetical protein